ncbi:O-antigen ligase family protein [Deefgea rivuli]|uniref:O-antigen ligase family protein n=1 Tax=Deefgea rivuli TaxID=400948 RepID=UPI0004837E00|nr:O-antigen ligase family protein [Deefgea rivuli]
MKYSYWFSLFSAVIAGLAIPMSTAAQNISGGLLLLSAILMLGSWRDLKEECQKPFAIVALSLGILFVVSILWTSASSEGGWGFILKLRAYFLIPFFLYVFSKPKLRNAFLIAFSAGVLLSVILSCISAWLDQPILRARQGDWAVFRDHISHNLFAGFLGVGIFSALLVKQWTGYKNILAIISLLLICYNVFFVVPGRTGQIIFLMMLGMVFVFWNWRKGLLLGSVFLLSAMIILPKYSSVIQGGIARVQSDLAAYSQGSTEANSVGIRLEFYKNSFALIQEKPLLGHGVGSYENEYQRIAKANQSLILESGNPHNNYLWFGVELGVLGIILLLALMGAAAWQGRHLEKMWKWSLYALLAGMGISSLANSLFVDNVSGFAFVLLCCALLNAPKELMTASNRTSSDAAQ